MRKTDMDAARANMAAHEARCQELLATGQKLLARIRTSSKYHGQSDAGALFPVVVASNGEYAVIGGPGGQYRLRDVDLFVVFANDVDPIQITFEK
jgi:hypothetical protein